MFMPDVAMQNNWLLYKISDGYKHRPLDLLAFRREVVTVYLMKYATRTRPSVCLGANSRGKLPDAVRLDGKDHCLKSNPTQRQYANKGHAIPSETRAHTAPRPVQAMAFKA